MTGLAFQEKAKGEAPFPEPLCDPRVYHTTDERIILDSARNVALCARRHRMQETSICKVSWSLSEVRL